jgi:protein-disulfide isomerase
MIGQWKFAALGALGGAVIAVAVVFAAAAFGYLPHDAKSDERMVRAYLLGHPKILIDMQNRMVEMQADEEDRAERKRQAAVGTLGLKTFFDPAVAYVTGPKDAKASVVEFFDYNCAHCRNTFPAVRAFYEAHRNDTRFAFIEFPIFGKESTNAARAAIAARRQGDKYVAFSFAMMGEKGAIDEQTMLADAQAAGLDMTKLLADMKDPAVDKTVKAAHALAAKLGIDGTPTFIVNGQVHSGEIQPEELAEMTGR